jgi:hypothetical protein
MERRRVVAAAAAEDDDSDISWSSNDPYEPTPEDKAAEQRALVDSFKTLKKVEDAANERLRLCLLEDARSKYVRADDTNGRSQPLLGV